MIVAGLEKLSVELDTLTVLPGNPRRGDVDAVANSLKRFGQRKPIVVRASDRTIIAGNHTWMAAKQLGWAQIAAVLVDDDAATAQAFALADNRTAELGGYDEQALLDLIRLVGDPDLLADTGWSEDAILELIDRVEPPSDDPPKDDAPSPPLIPHASLGDVWILGRHRLVCGDSTDPEVYARLLGEDRADLVVTDPPYNVAYVGKTSDSLTISNDAMSPTQFANFLAAFYRAALAWTKRGGAIYVFHASDVAFQRELIDAGWMHKQTLIWVKSTMVLSRQDYHWQHEPILYGWRPGAAHTWNADRTLTTLIDDQPNIAKMGKAELLEHLTSIYAASDIIREDKPARNAVHPTMKPVALIGRLIDNSSKPRQIVLDPFGGSGSTLMAAEHLNRRARLIELDPVYVDVICARWQEYTGLEPVNERTGQAHDFLDSSGSAATH